MLGAASEGLGGIHYGPEVLGGAGCGPLRQGWGSEMIWRGEGHVFDPQGDVFNPQGHVFDPPVHRM